MRIFRPALAAVSLLFANCAPARPPAAHPALWKVSDADTTIWLFGTVHVLPKDLAWRSPALDKAIAGSDRLVIEAVLDRSPNALGTVLATMGRATGLPPILERVPPAKRDDLKALIDKSKLPPHLLDGLKTWAAAMVLMGSSIRELSVSSDDGVEPALEAAFQKAGKPIEGLETAEQQLGYFDSLSEDAQRQFLESLITPGEDTRQEFDAMVAAWSSGNERAIATTFKDELGATPVLQAALVDRRNAAWADTIAKRLDQPGETLVAVGAGHLVGPGAVQALLAKRGIRVQRVQ